MKKTMWILTLLLFSIPVKADFDKGYKAYKNRDYSTAFVEFEKAAKQGQDNAQFSLGVMYANGQAVKQDNFKAVKWYTKAAMQGHAKAQFNLGLVYYIGQGVKQDNFKAAEWLTKAAKQGDVNAQYNLGRFYELGLGLTKSNHKALEWYGKSCYNRNQDGCDAYARLIK